MIKFVVVVNKQGQTKFVQYYSGNTSQRTNLEAELARTCLQRKQDQTSFFEYEGYKIVYKRYASLFFIVGIDNDENELAILEFIHNFVETLDNYFKNVCELDVMFNLERVHIILDEMIVNGQIIESSRHKILEPLLHIANSNK